MEGERMVTWSVVLGFAVLGVAPSEGAPVLDIGSRLELFVDHYLIDTMKGVDLQLHHPEPRETVLRFDQPWERLHCGYVTIIKDEDVYRLYYRGFPVDAADGSDVECTCYAESKDGIVFTRPNLGLFDYNGTRENNVILHGMPPLSHNFAPFLDARPGVPAAERYKAFAGVEKSGLHGFVSPDGIHWTKLGDAPLLTAGAFDSQNIGFWSEAEGCYLCYFRTWTGSAYAGFRTVSRATSPDFLTWSQPVEMTFGDTPREHLYTNQTRPYFRAPHIYIATAARFMQGRRVVPETQAEAVGSRSRDSGDCSDTVLITSRGGSQYDRTFMEGFVRPGIGLNNWTTRTNYVAHGVVPTGDNEMSLYVQRNYAQPTHCLQRLTLRTDGFVSVNAPYAGGEFLTKPLLFKGSKLVLNYATSAAGSVWVEIQDASGAPIAGFAQADCDEIIGDAIERSVSWKGNSDVSGLAGKPVRLRLVMKDADLYSIRFVE
jgi:hypothetical protein